MFLFFIFIFIFDRTFFIYLIEIDGQSRILKTGKLSSATTFCMLLWIYNETTSQESTQERI
jgi:hypothetical protein